MMKAISPHLFFENVFHHYFAKLSPETLLEDRSFRFTALVFFLSFFISLLMAPINYFIGGWPHVIFGLFFTLTSLFCFFGLRSAAHVNHSKLVFITIANLLILSFSLIQGTLSEMHFYYVPSMALPFLMFPPNHRKSLIYSVTLPSLLLLVDVIIKFKQSLLGWTATPDTIVSFMGMLNTLFASGLVAFSFFYFYRQTIRGESKLIAQNATLVNQEKMSTLGIVAAGVAHEINNPLTIILGNAVGAHKIVLAQEQKDPRLIKQLESIKSTTNRIAKIVASLRVFSRDSRKDDTHMLIIEEILEQTLTLTHEKLKAVPLKTTIPKEVLLRANGTELLQIFINLITNAIESQKNKDNPWIEIIATEKDPYLEIIFKDSGKGISPEIQKKIFTPFFTTKPVGEGTGLGLSISKKLIESRGGLLYYQEIDGHTAFVLNVPLFTLDTPLPESDPGSSNNL